MYGEFFISMKIAGNMADMGGRHWRTIKAFQIRLLSWAYSCSHILAAVTYSHITVG